MRLPMSWCNRTRAFITCTVLFLLAISIFALNAAHAASQPSPRTWFAVAGDESPDSSIHDTAIVPGDLWINVGDTVTWKPQNHLNVLVFLPAGTTVEPLFSFAPDQITSVGGSHYDGKSYYSSGLLGPMPHMNGLSFVQQYSLTFDVPGTFTYYNLPFLHASAVVHVQPAGSSYPHTQQFYNNQMQAEHAHMLAVGKVLVAKARLISEKAWIVSKEALVVAGIDQGTISLMRFSPSQITVHVGELLTFTNYASEAHTITFGTSPPSLAQASQVYGNPSGYDGSYPLNSGFIGTSPRGHSSTVISFSMSFSKPGTYPYYCVPHAVMGMVGTVSVVP